MIQRDRSKRKTIYLSATVVAIVALSVGYALLSKFSSGEPDSQLLETSSDNVTITKDEETGITILRGSKADVEKATK